MHINHRLWKVIKDVMRLEITGLKLTGYILRFAKKYFFWQSLWLFPLWRRQGFFQYAGTQDYSSCFCGNSYGNYGLDQTCSCTSSCSADTTQICGGSLRNSIYRLFGTLNFY